jgi:hypothetical protein
MYGGEQKCIEVFEGNLKERDHLGSAWDNNIKMYIKEIGWEGQVTDVACDKDKWP